MLANTNRFAIFILEAIVAEKRNCCMICVVVATIVVVRFHRIILALIVNWEGSLIPWLYYWCGVRSKKSHEVWTIHVNLFQIRFAKYIPHSINWDYDWFFMLISNISSNFRSSFYLSFSLSLSLNLNECANRKCYYNL